MVDEPPERPPLANLLDALSVRRNVAIGLSIGIGLAVLLYVYRVVLIGSVPGERGSPLLFAGLAFVLAVTVAALIAIVLTAISAWSLARNIE